MALLLLTAAVFLILNLKIQGTLVEYLVPYSILEEHLLLVGVSRESVGIHEEVLAAVW